MLSQPPTKPQEIESKINNCKNHPTVPSRFFVLEQPQVRYCKNCALNMALCGRKIQKQLTPQEYERKVLIESVVEKLRNNICEVQINQAYYQQLASIIELSSHTITHKIEVIDNFIKHLAKIRFKLESDYENELHSKIKNFNEKRKDLSNDRKSIQQELESIESNFGNIIQTQDAIYFDGLKAGWKEVIARTCADLLSQQQFSFERNKIGECLSIFQREFKEISRLKVLEPIPQEPLVQFKEEENKQNGSGEGFNCLKLVEELKLNLTANAQSKVRSNNRKPITERQSKQTHKNKKGCILNEKDGLQVVAPARRFNH